MTVNATTIGIDLSTDPSDTGLAVIKWDGATPAVDRLVKPVHDEDVVTVAREHPDATVAIDCPFGWPVAFVDYVVAQREGQDVAAAELSKVEASFLRHRETDRFVRRVVADLVGAGDANKAVRPFSVAMDKIGATAVRCQRILHLLKAEQRAGRVIEVYPAASLSVWKGDARAGFDDLVKAASILLSEVAPKHRTNDHCRDAVVCAMSARAYDLGAVFPESDNADPVPESEGWIQLPKPGSLTMLAARP